MLPTVANVAVGFDILGFALENRAMRSSSEGQEKGLKITEIRGAQGKLPYDIMKNTAGFAAYKLLEYLEETERPLENGNPTKNAFGSGLGSSAVR